MRKGGGEDGGLEGHKLIGSGLERGRACAVRSPCWRVCLAFLFRSLLRSSSAYRGQRRPLGSVGEARGSEGHRGREKDSEHGRKPRTPRCHRGRAGPRGVHPSETTPPPLAAEAQ